MVRNKQGLVHNCKTNTAEEYNEENIEDYAQYPNNIGGGLLMFPETAFQITIVVYAMRKKKEKNKEVYKPREGDKVIAIYQ
jgi:hypothetical protein